MAEKKKKIEKKLSVLVVSPEEEIWSGKADSVSSENSLGKFDILPEHANFVTFIQDHPINIKTKDGVKEYSFSKAVISAETDAVRIFANV